MESQNLKWRYRGWCPSNDYEVHEVTGPALRKRFDRPLHQKGHVAFKTILEEPIPVAAEATPVPDTHETSKSAFRSVDQNADAFIKQERRRIELARLKSLGQI
ncbi:hypothetical protein DEO72_LG11g143 [Vigna unguiculata]|uniref:Uncharacterized protein n=1 Tax=Vigna unguiculata TaxID=3917 RepID=A0A4D6NHD2_VIGUN|nr:hypothetical protein DEO72_LG11g143 [Vigna unguiculata]